MFRYYLHSTSAIFIFFAASFDLLVWYYGKNLELYADDDEPKKEKRVTEKYELPESEPLNK